MKLMLCSLMPNRQLLVLEWGDTDGFIDDTEQTDLLTDIFVSAEYKTRDIAM